MVALTKRWVALTAWVAAWRDVWKREDDLLEWLRDKAFPQVGSRGMLGEFKPEPIMIHGRKAVLTALSIDLSHHAMGPEGGRVTFEYVVIERSK